MSNERWSSLKFETSERGVSSAYAPELLPDNQSAWGMNVDCRGGKMATRPNLALLGDLPSGLVQGAEFFGVQGGMIVTSIAGNMYRLRIGPRSMTYEQIYLPWRNSGTIKRVWMCQTVETLVIQDGQSAAILYNGSTATRAGATQVPRGRQMAYGNGRLWVAVDANNLVAGDIRTNEAGSELYFTETQYLTGGGALFFPNPITALSFIPVTGLSNYGALMVFALDSTEAVRADITARDEWGLDKSFVTAILRAAGTPSNWSVVPVNQDVYWRDSFGGIRSIRNALANEDGPGNTPISREVSRITDFESRRYLAFCSGVYHDNRLLYTANPFLLPNGGVGFSNVISLDFAPLSTMSGKAQPSYNGNWNGVTFVKLVGGSFGGRQRAFALSTDSYGVNRLWEFGTGARADTYRDADNVLIENPITCFVETQRRDFGAEYSRFRKRLARCDVWLSGIDDEIELSVYWRPDNSQKWLQWDEDTACAKTTDDSTAVPHVWKNLAVQDRPQFKTFTIPNGINEMAGYAAEVGFEFQIRLVWTGRLRIHRVMVHAKVLDDPPQANREVFIPTCIENDISGNSITYQIDAQTVYYRVTSDGDLRVTEDDDPRILIP